MKMFIKLVIILIIPIFLYSADYRKEAQSIEDSFKEVIELYKKGDVEKAKELTQNAYFGHFENLEGGIRINLSQKKAYSMEKQFGEIRKAIIAKVPLEQIISMIDNLNKEIEEVLPIIENGVRLVGEKSHDGGLSSANMAPEQADNSNPWIQVGNEIKSTLEEAQKAYDDKNKQGVIDAMNKIKFNLYRNKKLEIAFRQYNSQSFDQMVQQVMGAIISKNTDMSGSQFTQALKDVGDLINTGILKLPKESYSIAPQSIQAQEEPQVDFTKVVETIKTKMDLVLKTYESGDVKKAISDSQDIYFDEYEASGMESKVGAIDSALKTSTERSFTNIVALMKDNASIDALKKEQEVLFQKLQESIDKAGGDTSPWALFIYALTIILREGFEALIIVTAVVAYLVKTGNQKRLSIVYSSLSVAIILSFVTAFAVNIIFGQTAAGQSREIIEGATMLIAVVLLFYVGFWLLSNAGSKKWSAYIKSQMQDSLTSGDSKALWWTVFLAVYREGAETVLFYQALIFGAKTTHQLSMVGMGFVVGLIALIAIYFILKYFSIKIPIKPFFIITSAIIFYMSIVFTGKGVMELVEGKLFVPTAINGFPTIEWLGIYPYYESLIPQAIMVLALIIGVLIMKKIENKS